MGDPQLSVEDLEYVADMLRAIAWVKDDIGPLSAETLSDLEQSLGAAESALRRVVAELEVTSAATSSSN